MKFRSRKGGRINSRSRTLRSVSKGEDIAKDFDKAKKQITTKLISESKSLLKKYPYRSIILGIILLTTGFLSANNIKAVGNLWESIKRKVSGKTPDQMANTPFRPAKYANPLDPSGYGPPLSQNPFPTNNRTVNPLDPGLYKQRSRRRSRSRSRKLSMSTNDRIIDQTKRIVRMIGE